VAVVRFKKRRLIAVMAAMLLSGCASYDKPMTSCIDRATAGEDFNQGINMALHQQLSHLSSLIWDFYPEEAREKRIEGRVRVKMVMNQTGSLVSPSLSKSSGSKALDDAAMKFAGIIEKRTRTSPLLKKGYCFTEESDYIIPVHFSLHDCDESVCSFP